MIKQKKKKKFKNSVQEQETGIETDGMMMSANTAPHSTR